MRSTHSKKLVFILLASLFGAPALVNAQADNLMSTVKELSLTLDRSKDRRVQQVSEVMQEAGNLVDRTVNLGDEAEIRDNLEDIRKKFESSREDMNVVYEGILENFYARASRVFINKFDHARYYDQKVDAFQNAASLAIYRADSVKDAHESAVYFADAYDNLVNAFLNQLRAIRIYQDFPIEYPYEWDDFFKQRQIMLAREGALDPDVQEEKQKEAAESFKIIFYRVQIAAHSRPIPDNQLAEIYRGNLIVNMNFEDGWYKYTIGNFQRYDLALDLLRSCNVKRAFIVAYDENNVKQDMRNINKNQ
ncbi:MAG: hypothetical protein U0T82_08520 [Bacteroidales bacterium]